MGDVVRLPCRHPDHEAYPWYGGAPGTSGTVLDENGTVAFFDGAPSHPEGEWPPNFEPDPDQPGFGTWFCPECREGME